MNPVARVKKQLLSQSLPVTLLDGKVYTPSSKTNVMETFRRFGWTPPSEDKK